jgi:lipoprotein-releasing system permease protein
MSMRVMDKTREIGMLLAMGANRRNIIKIFLFESTMLGVIGSALGSVLGVAAINLVGNFEFEIQAGVREITTIPLTIYLWDVPTFSLLAIALCLIAGIYPAIKASRLDPVDAIKG